MAADPAETPPAETPNPWAVGMGVTSATPEPPPPPPPDPSDADADADADSVDPPPVDTAADGDTGAVQIGPKQLPIKPTSQRRSTRSQRMSPSDVLSWADEITAAYTTAEGPPPQKETEELAMQSAVMEPRMERYGLLPRDPELKREHFFVGFAEHDPFQFKRPKAAGRAGLQLQGAEVRDTLKMLPSVQANQLYNELGARWRKGAKEASEDAASEYLEVKKKWDAYQGSLFASEKGEFRAIHAVDRDLLKNRMVEKYTAFFNAERNLDGARRAFREVSQTLTDMAEKGEVNWEELVGNTVKEHMFVSRAKDSSVNETDMNMLAYELMELYTDKPESYAEINKIRENTFRSIKDYVKPADYEDVKRSLITGKWTGAGIRFIHKRLERVEDLLEEAAGRERGRTGIAFDEDSELGVLGFKDRQSQIRALESAMLVSPVTGGWPAPHPGTVFPEAHPRTFGAELAGRKELALRAGAARAASMRRIIEQVLKEQRSL